MLSANTFNLGKSKFCRFLQGVVYITGQRYCTMLLEENVHEILEELILQCDDTNVTELSRKVLALAKERNNETRTPEI